MRDEKSDGVFAEFCPGDGVMWVRDGSAQPAVVMGVNNHAAKIATIDDPPTGYRELYVDLRSIARLSLTLDSYTLEYWHSIREEIDRHSGR